MVFVWRGDWRSTMSVGLPRVICVIGPTAVGKSAVAEGVALELGGSVISVDSMQVYRGMDIGTAKLMPEERACPLLMVDVAEIDEPYSVARFQRAARSCVDELHAQGQQAVLCGGTGLYLDAVIDEMSFPDGEANSPMRSQYEEMARVRGTMALYELLQERDPQSALVIHPHNTRRVVRALEMLDEGVSYAEHHAGLKCRSPHYDAHIWALTLPRDVLYERIDKRVDAMFEKGLVDEVRRLMQSGLDTSSTAGMAIGYKEVMSALSGEMGMTEARLLVKRNTRRYAKRQLSWIKRDGRARCINMAEFDADEAVEFICENWRTC